MRLLGIYLCNYKLKNEHDFKKLCELIDQDGGGKHVLEIILKMTQADENGNLYSDTIEADKYGRMTPYLTKEEIEHYEDIQAHVARN